MSARKLGRKGKLDRDLPFREPKTFAIFPKCFGGREFFGCERLFQGSLGLSPIRRQFARFINRRVQNGRDLASCLFCRRHLQTSWPAALLRLLAQHEAQLRDGCRAIDALDSRRAGTACGVCFYRIRSTSDFGAGGMSELCSVFCATQDCQADGKPLWRVPRTTS